MSGAVIRQNIVPANRVLYGDGPEVAKDNQTGLDACAGSLHFGAGSFPARDASGGESCQPFLLASLTTFIEDVDDIKNFVFHSKSGILLGLDRAKIGVLVTF